MIKSTVLWDMTPCSLVNSFQYSGGGRFIWQVDTYVLDYVVPLSGIP
jgi:hypothetical protein